MGNRDKNKIYFYRLQSGSVSQLIKYENLDMSLLMGHFFMLIFNLCFVMLAGTSEDECYKN